jgi:2-dehydropantoate 2-reductase
MKIAVVGAGAIGGYLGAKLAAAGEQVTFIARGAHLDALRRHGVKLIQEDGTQIHVRELRAYAQAIAPDPHDVILLTVKAHQVAALAADLQHLCHAETSIVTMQNGIPWWYFYKHGGAYEGRAVHAADPQGIIASHLDPARVIGSVVYPAANLTAPGEITVVEGNRFTLGELDGSTTPRLVKLAACLSAAGFKAPITPDIRSEIWLKLWGNLSFNPISALTRATLVDICQFPLTRQLAASMMIEAETIAHKLGITFRVSLERRIAGAEKVGAHKTSMLQDIEQGRAPEIEALVGAVVELGEMTLTPTPHISALYAVVSLLAKTLAASRYQSGGMT